jgi:hypothetical protein
MEGCFFRSGKKRRERGHFNVQYIRSNFQRVYSTFGAYIIRSGDDIPQFGAYMPKRKKEANYEA